MLSSDAWLPFAASLFHIVHLRRMFVENRRLLLISGENSPEMANEMDGTSDIIVINVENNNVFLSFSNFADSNVDWKDVNIGSKISGIVYPILEAAQPLIAASQVLRSDNLWQVAANGTAHIIEKGHSGMRNLAPVSATDLVGPIAMMALANALIQQKKMEEIEKSLAEIKATLQDVSKFQKSERRAVLTGSIRYFQQVASSVLAGELATEILHGLERHEIELLRVQDHLVEEIRERIASLGAIKKEGWGSGKYVKSIDDELTAIGKSYNEIFLCVRARACAYMLLCAFPGRESGKRSRFKDINDTLEDFSLSGKFSIALDQFLREKLAIISSYETKGLLLSKQNTLFENIYLEISSIVRGFEHCHADFIDEAAQLSLSIKLKNGCPVAIRVMNALSN